MTYTPQDGRANNSANIADNNDTALAVPAPGSRADAPSPSVSAVPASIPSALETIRHDHCLSVVGRTRYANKPNTDRYAAIYQAAGMSFDALLHPAPSDICSFCDFPATCTVASEWNAFDACPRCAAAWKRDPGFLTGDNWEAALKTAFDDPRVLPMLSKGVAAGSFPLGDAGPISWSSWLADLIRRHAQAIEARSGETRQGLDPKDESAVAKPCAETQSGEKANG